MREVILSILATYAISLVVSSYAGPFDVFARMRGNWSVFRCFVCLSFWIGLIVACLNYLTFSEYFAVVGGAILIYEVTRK